ncbi:hypothetical protein RQP50_02225 [Paenibacillus sp. chi10]|uniref:UDP-glucuronosyltransferase n=1 Tax=Paenibacillus suaedae TaxID=3077233 RepID=A0AAJ2JQU3_9BACL|nr:hypothetical protein [Paenibacillus sp. chi10]MDT8975056.1 hypothetical protein [Paenibacillus sp. chi10]
MFTLLNASPITILTSGNSLGAYVPGIRLVEQLRRRGIPAEAEVLERLFPEETRRNMIRTKQLFHNSFEAAKMGTRMARDIGLTLDEAVVANLLQRWRDEGRSVFLAVTGFWIPVLQRYEKMMHPEPIRAEFLRLDAVDTPSYRPYEDVYPRYRHHWLYRLGREGTSELYAKLTMSDADFVPYPERERRIVVHGGGWGIGTYRSKIANIQRHYSLAIVAYHSEEVLDALPCDRIYMTDPNWHPWLEESLSYDRTMQAARATQTAQTTLTNLSNQIDTAYPPMAEWKRNEPLTYERGTNGPLLYEVIRNSLAIVSKPGGGTLIDSLSSATPLIYLEPFGEHERANAELWEQLGFGISYDRWLEADCSWEMLYELHCNLKSQTLSLSDFGGMYT